MLLRLSSVTVPKRQPPALPGLLSLLRLRVVVPLGGAQVWPPLCPPPPPPPAAFQHGCFNGPACAPGLG